MRAGLCEKELGRFSQDGSRDMIKARPQRSKDRRLCWRKKKGVLIVKGHGCWGGNPDRG